MCLVSHVYNFKWSWRIGERSLRELPEALAWVDKSELSKKFQNWAEGEALLVSSRKGCCLLVWTWTCVPLISRANNLIQELVWREREEEKLEPRAMHVTLTAARRTLGEQGTLLYFHLVNLMQIFLFWSTLIFCPGGYMQFQFTQIDMVVKPPQTCMPLTLGNRIWSRFWFSRFGWGLGFPWAPRGCCWGRPLGILVGRRLDKPTLGLPWAPLGAAGCTGWGHNNQGLWVGL